MNPDQNPTPETTPAVVPVTPTGQLPVAEPVIPEVPIVPPTPEPPKSKNTIAMVLVGIVAILLLIIVALVLVVTSKTEPQITEPSPTAKAVVEESSVSLEPSEEVGMSDWKSYSNTAYNYSFSYPLDFVIQGYDADAGGAVYSQTNNILIYALGNLEYVDRVIDIQHFNLLIAPTPTSDWKSSSASVGQKEATKYTSVSSQVKFDIYHVPYISGGLEIMVNKSASIDSVNQILSTFEFTD